MSKTNYFQGVDRLRAVAALSVLLAHVVGPSLPGIAKYIFTGYPAVVAFFVISGFCIHAPYVKATLPVRAFWLARFVRICVPVAITPSPSTSNNTKSTYFAAMIYYRKTLFGRGPKLTAVHECALQMNSILFGVHRDWREADVMLQLVAAEEASD